MRRVVGADMGVKAAGGVRDLEGLKTMVAAGASRVGASAGVKIVQESRGQKRDCGHPALAGYVRSHCLHPSASSWLATLAAPEGMSIPCSSNAFRILRRNSRPTSHCSDGTVLIRSFNVHRTSRQVRPRP